MAAKIEVLKGDHRVRALAEDGTLLATYPASIGSDEKPAPSGTLKVVGVARNPDYTYDPEYKFKGVKAKEKFTLKPGPNNPVGTVWIDLSEDSYGIHGTPEPDKVGKTFYERSLKQKADGGAPLEKGAALCAFLLSAESDGITGRLLSAVWDPWADLGARRAELAEGDIYTLRRIVPSPAEIGSHHRCQHLAILLLHRNPEAANKRQEPQSGSSMNPQQSISTTSSGRASPSTMRPVPGGGKSK